MASFASLTWPVKRRVMAAYYVQPRLRRVLRPLLAPRLADRGVDVFHLGLVQEEDALGPVQRDEALLLFGLTRVLRPRTVVEIGFLDGMSAFTFLRALEPGAELHSFDISDDAQRAATRLGRTAPNLHFHRVSQDAIEAAHLGGRKADLVFLDASHDLELNRRTFERLLGLTSETAVIAVHDTGTWVRSHMTPAHHEIAKRRPEHWLTPEHYQQERGEREFVNWIRETHPEFVQLHLHTTATIRHGMTLLQRQAPLVVTPDG